MCHLSSFPGGKLELLSDPISINVIFSFHFPSSCAFISPVFVSAFSVSNDNLTRTRLIFFLKFVLPYGTVKSKGRFGLRVRPDPGAQRLLSGLGLFLAQPCFPLG